MLQMLRGKHNVVHTGYCIIGAEEGEFTAEVVSSIIKMRDYGDDLIEQYLATGEPMDKAGAYALNAKGAILVDRVIDGDVSAIIGLPLGPVADVLVDYGVNVWQTSLPVI
jgi:septum formation protein